MALSPQEIKTSYPLPVYNYRVEISGVSIAFSEISGLDVEYEPITYKESKTTQPGAGPNILYMPGQPTPVVVSMKKGYVVGSSKTALFDWIASTRLNQIEKKDILVHLCDEKGVPVVSWKLIDAFPTKLQSPSFDANSNEVAVESMELIASDVQLTEN